MDADAAASVVVARPARPAAPSPRALLARGVPVRAAVRAGPGVRRPRRDDTGRRRPGDRAGLAAALDGARAAYHLAPNVHPDEVGIADRVADAAAAAGLPRLVFHSVLHPDDARMPHHLRKAEAEALLREAPRRAAHGAAARGLPPEPPRRRPAPGC